MNDTQTMPRSLEGHARARLRGVSRRRAHPHGRRGVPSIFRAIAGRSISTLPAMSSGYLVRVETFAQSIQFILSEAAGRSVTFADRSAYAGRPGEDTPPIRSGKRRAPAGDQGVALAQDFAACALGVDLFITDFHSRDGVASCAYHHASASSCIAFTCDARRPCRIPERCAWRLAFSRGRLGCFGAGDVEPSCARNDLKDTSLFLSVPASPEQNWGMIISGILVVLISLSVHECAHAITAWWLGDGLAKSLGRVTLNPLAHIDPVGTVLLPIHPCRIQGPNLLRLRQAGARLRGNASSIWPRAYPDFGGWSRLEPVAGRRIDDVLLGAVCALRLAVPGAGVTHLASFSLATPVVASGFPLASYFGLACTLLKLSFVVNVALAFFNLIPIPPLDGSWVLEHLFPRTLGPFYSVIRPYGFLIFVLALYSDVLNHLRVPVDYVLAAGFALLAATTGW